MAAGIFSRDFDQDLVRERAARHQIQHSEEALRAAVEAAREAAFREGHAAGLAEARSEAAASIPAQTREAIQTLSAAAETLLTDADRHRTALEAQLTEFVFSVFEKVRPELVHSQAAPRAEAEVRRAIRMALGGATITLRLPTTALAEIGDSLAAEIDACGFTGRVRMEAGPDMGPGDAYVDWGNGFMEYSYAAICDRILALLRDAAAAEQTVEDRETLGEDVGR